MKEEKQPLLLLRENDSRIMLEYSWTLDADYTLNNVIASIVSTCTDVQPEVLWQKNGTSGGKE